MQDPPPVDADTQPIIHDEEPEDLPTATDDVKIPAPDEQPARPQEE